MLCAAQAIEKLEQMTRSNNGWILEKEEVLYSVCVTHLSVDLISLGWD